MKKILAYAAKQTIPIMLGYVFMGMAWGLMLQDAGFSPIWAFIIALTVYTGSGQFLMVSMLAGGAGFFSVFIMQLSINSRHMFYGLSFLERFRSMGKAYPYMIFSLTDETYSLLCYTKIPDHLDEKKATFSIAMLDQFYWIVGCTLGATLGQFSLFNITGVDFAMTALFTVIFVEQWQAYRSHIPALVGFGCGIVSLVAFGPDKFILPALFASVGFLLAFRRFVEMRTGETGESEKEGEECQSPRLKR